MKCLQWWWQKVNSSKQYPHIIKYSYRSLKISYMLGARLSTIFAGKSLQLLCFPSQRWNTELYQIKPAHASVSTRFPEKLCTFYIAILLAVSFYFSKGGMNIWLTSHFLFTSWVYMVTRGSTNGKFTPFESNPDLNPYSDIFGVNMDSQLES